MAKKQKSSVNKLTGQTCPMCFKKTLTLMETKEEIPYFGNVFVFSMECSDCDFRKSDVEAEEKHDPCKYGIEVSSEKDMKIRFIKSSEATVKIPHMVTITPGPASVGYVTNIEGLLNRVKEVLEAQKESAEDDTEKKKLKSMLKKLLKVMWGQEKLKIIVEDPTGNSAIISDKAKKEKLK